jgi:hypothetical protein
VCGRKESVVVLYKVEFLSIMHDIVCVSSIIRFSYKRK